MTHQIAAVPLMKLTSEGLGEHVGAIEPRGNPDEPDPILHDGLANIFIALAEVSAQISGHGSVLKQKMDCRLVVSEDDRGPSLGIAHVVPHISHVTSNLNSPHDSKDLSMHGAEHHNFDR